MNAAHTIQLLVALTSYRPGAMQDDFGDGRYQTFDAAEVQVIEGPAAVRRFAVMVDARDMSAVARWNRPGRTLRVRVDPSLLGGLDILFAGALTIEEDRP